MIEVKVTVDFSDRVIAALTALGVGTKPAANNEAQAPVVPISGTEKATARSGSRRAVSEPVAKTTPPAETTAAPTAETAPTEAAPAAVTTKTEPATLESARKLMSEKITASDANRAVIVEWLGGEGCKNISQLSGKGPEKVAEFYAYLKTLQ